MFAEMGGRQLIRTTSRSAAAFVIAVSAALSVPAAASAHRLATNGEAAAMIYSASGRYYGNSKVAEPRSAPLRCFSADISTVVNGSRWGAWTFSKYAETHEQQCRIANGITIEHKIGKQWYVLWEGSEGYPPTHKTRVGTLTLMGVPRAVAKDLTRGLG
jgi:hypothetical protein